MNFAVCRYVDPTIGIRAVKFWIRFSRRADSQSIVSRLSFPHSMAVAVKLSQGVAAGVDDYLTKMFSARERLACVNSHLSIARVPRESNARNQRQR